MPFFFEFLLVTFSQKPNRMSLFKCLKICGLLLQYYHWGDHWLHFHVNEIEIAVLFAGKRRDYLWLRLGEEAAEGLGRQEEKLLSWLSVSRFRIEILQFNNANVMLRLMSLCPLIHCFQPSTTKRKKQRETEREVFSTYFLCVSCFSNSWRTGSDVIYAKEKEAIISIFFFF